MKPKYLFPFLVIILLAVLVWTSQKNEAPLSAGPATTTASWQTYRNEQYGFEFKYPPGWHIFLPKGFPNSSVVNILEDTDREDFISLAIRENKWGHYDNVLKIWQEEEDILFKEKQIIDGGLVISFKTPWVKNGKCFLMINEKNVFELCTIDEATENPEKILRYSEILDKILKSFSVKEKSG